MTKEPNGSVESDTQESSPVNAVTLIEKEFLLPGNRLCPGCALSLAYRHILKALEGQAVLTVPASCLTVLHGMYPVTSVTVPCVNTPFASTAASAAGLVAGLRALGRSDLTVVAVAGDGGTFDIGIQALSGAAERHDDFIYICYDNEGYMNTGNQRSGSSPLGAISGTTPVLGKREHQKDIVAVMEAHSLPYLATANASYPLDLYQKVRKARLLRGLRFIHVFIPCPPGWGFPFDDTIRIGEMAVQSGWNVLYEIEDGVFRLSMPSASVAMRDSLKPVREFLASQSRFDNLTEEKTQELQDWVSLRWRRFLSRSNILH